MERAGIAGILDGVAFPQIGPVFPENRCAAGEAHPPDCPSRSQCGAAFDALAILTASLII